MSPRVFIFIGRSGCGKGTQANLIVKRLKELDPSRDTLYIYAGNGYREFIKGSSLSQRLAAKIYTAGGLEPEFLTIHVWSHMLVEKYKDGDHIIFDGTPRKFHEAGALDSVFGFYGLTEKPVVIYLDISKDEAVRRLLARKRSDDTRAAVEARLEWYEKEVAGAMKFFDGNSDYLFLKIDGQRSVEEIHADIVAKAGL